MLLLNAVANSFKNLPIMGFLIMRRHSHPHRASQQVGIQYTTKANGTKNGFEREEDDEFHMRIYL